MTSMGNCGLFNSKACAWKYRGVGGIGTGWMPIQELLIEKIWWYDYYEWQWLIQFNSNDENDSLIWYDALLKYVDKDAITFPDYQQYLPVANQITLLQKKK